MFVLSNFIGYCPVGAEVFHEKRRTDGWIEKTKLIVAFGNSTNAPKTLLFAYHRCRLRQTDRQTDRQTHTHTHIPCRLRQTDTHTHTPTHPLQNETDRQTNRHTHTSPVD
jgi:hypothetical protein